MPSGAGLSFFSPSTALLTMPFFGPSLAGRSNRITGTRTLTRWAAICAPMTPAPRTATLLDVESIHRCSRRGIHSARIQVCVRPSSEMPTKPRTSSFVPLSTSFIFDW